MIFIYLFTSYNARFRDFFSNNLSRAKVVKITNVILIRIVGRDSMGDRQEIEKKKEEKKRISFG